MKKIILSIVAVAALVVMPMGVKAQNPDVVNAVPAKVNIILPLTLTTDVADGLDFGTIAKNTAGAGTVTMAATSDAAPEVVQSAGTLYAVETTLSTPQAGKFTISGEGSQSYTLAVSDPPSLGTGLSVVCSSSITEGTNTLPVGGSATLYVGGVLTVAASATAGTYSADFSVTVSYN